MNYLMTKLGEDWSVHADAGLIHDYEYWSFVLETDNVYLELRIDRRDVTAGTLRQNVSDADLEIFQELNMLSGDISNGLIEFGCKRQVTAERSSAASETAAVYQLEKALVEADPTQAEVELIERCADWTKAAATICTRTIYPTSELV